MNFDGLRRDLREDKALASRQRREWDVADAMEVFKQWLTESHAPLMSVDTATGYVKQATHDFAVKKATEYQTELNILKMWLATLHHVAIEGKL